MVVGLREGGYSVEEGGRGSWSRVKGGGRSEEEELGGGFHAVVQGDCAATIK